ncbi:MAG: TRAM domain-containing protein [Polyangiaceae bacterium]
MRGKKQRGEKQRGEKQAAVRTLRIESIAAGGAGVAHVEGRVVFVARTAPGDVVEAAVEAGSGATLRGRLVTVVEAGPERVEPACAHFEACGGAI